MARFIRWVAEPFTVFGIGALLNLILSAAASCPPATRCSPRSAG